jgi:hypothetical protein
MPDMSIVGYPGRGAEDNFRVLKRDQLKTFAAAEIIGGNAVRICLPKLIYYC